MLTRGERAARGKAASSRDGAGPLELVLPDGSRMPLGGQVTIGRAPSNTIRLGEPSVSRTHARIVSTPDGGATLEDAGSSYGTWLDGSKVEGPAPLHDGAQVRLGDVDLVVERVRTDDEAGRTVIVPPGVSQAIATVAAMAGGPPRVRSGYALKRLEAGEGDRRWVLEHLRGGRFVRLTDADIELFGLVDGTRDLTELVAEAQQRAGEGGPARLAALLVELSERGFLAGAGDEPEEEKPRGWQRLVTPRRRAWDGAGDLFESLYRRGGWALFSRPALWAMAAVAVVGAGAFAYLVAGRYGTPFVVASKLGLGGLVFLLGRLALASVHETAHGLALASVGRRVREAGLKVVLIFPYLYVDTSEAWFEPRRRRIAVSAAGPVSDFVLGGAFAIGCLALAPGATRDVLFQLAFGAYLAALLNLNPFIERDGYHMLTDVLNQPGLRRRAREQLERRLTGARTPADSRVLARYSLAGVVWLLVAGLLAVLVSLRYVPSLERLAPDTVVHVVIVLVWLGAFVPLVALVGGPLWRRYRHRET